MSIGNLHKGKAQQIPTTSANPQCYKMLYAINQLTAINRLRLASQLCHLFIHMYIDDRFVSVDLVTVDVKTVELQYIDLWSLQLGTVELQCKEF